MTNRIFEADHLAEAYEQATDDKRERVTEIGRIDPLFKPLLDFIRNQVEPYQKISRQPAEGYLAVDSADYCNDLLRQIRSTSPSDQVLDNFFAWATQSFDWPALLHVLAAHKAWREADRAMVFRHAERAMAVDSTGSIRPALTLLGQGRHRRGGG